MCPQPNTQEEASQDFLCLFTNCPNESVTTLIALLAFLQAAEQMDRGYWQTLQVPAVCSALHSQLHRFKSMVIKWQFPTSHSKPVYSINSPSQLGVSKLCHLQQVSPSPGCISTVTQWKLPMRLSGSKRAEKAEEKKQGSAYDSLLYTKDNSEGRKFPSWVRTGHHYISWQICFVHQHWDTIWAYGLWREPVFSCYDWVIVLSRLNNYTTQSTSDTIMNSGIRRFPA